MSIGDFINNRELSTIIWFSIIITISIFQITFRKLLITVLTTLFSTKLIILFSSLIAYVLLWIILFYKVGLWDITAIKDTIIWIIGAITILFKMANSDNTN